MHYGEPTHYANIHVLMSVIEEILMNYVGCVFNEERKRKRDDTEGATIDDPEAVIRELRAKLQKLETMNKKSRVKRVTKSNHSMSYNNALNKTHKNKGKYNRGSVRKHTHKKIKCWNCLAAGHHKNNCPKEFNKQLQNKCYAAYLAERGFNNV